MITEPRSLLGATLPRAQHLIILVLGLCLAGICAWRTGFAWQPSPAPTPPLHKYFIEISGDSPHPGIHVFPAPPTCQEVWEAAGGRGVLPNASQPLSSGSRVIISSDRGVTLERLAGKDLLTLGLALDPNQATAEDLEAIPGIGPVLARRIVEFREEQGPFQTIEDLLEVKGVGSKILEKIRLYVIIIANSQGSHDAK
jgi:competence protein ComEA